MLIKMVPGQWYEAQIRLHSFHIWILNLRLLGSETRGNDYIITRLPVGGGVDGVLVGDKQGIHDTEQLSCAATGRGRIRLDEADHLVGIDDKHRPDRVGDAGGADVGDVLVVEPVPRRTLLVSSQQWAADEKGRDPLHIISMGNLAILIANDRKCQRTASDLGNVVDPSIVRLNRIGGQADQLDAALGEFGLVLG